MKRTKPFLAVTTCLLAIAGISAAKVSKFGATFTRYYCTGKPIVHGSAYRCITFVGNNTSYDPNGTAVYKINYKGGLYTLYTSQDSEAAFRFCTVSGNPLSLACKHFLLYSTND